MGKRESLREAGGRPRVSDPNLVNRLAEYGLTHSLNDMDAAVEYLRRNYPEYRRKQVVPFRKYCMTLLPAIRRRIQALKSHEEADAEEDWLREREDAHISQTHGVGDMNEDMTFDADAKEPKTLDTDEIAAFAPPHQIAEAAKAALAQSSKSPQRGSSLHTYKLVHSETLSRSVVQEQNGRPYLPLVRSKAVDDRESTGVAQVRKRERELEQQAKASNKKGKYMKGEKEKEKEDRPGTSSAAGAPRNVSFRDFGGIEPVLEMIRELIEYPLVHPNVYDRLGVQPTRGVLLHGPPGCGKTMLANAIAVETGVPFLKISAPEVVSGMSGESEAKVRSLFADAVKVAPCIVFIDEIDAIAPKRETAQREMERRIVAQLLTCIDDLNHPVGDLESKSEGKTYKRPGHVIVIGATNRPDSLDPALRRAGRFDQEIALGIPDENARARILSVLSRNLRLEGSFDFKRIARRTPGFVGADLAALAQGAAALAVKRIFSSKETRALLPSASESASVSDCEEHSIHGGSNADEEPSTLAVIKEDSSRYRMQIDDDEKWRVPWSEEELEHLAITMEDFENAVEKVQPSAKREGFTTIPDVTWEDVGSLADVREDLEFSICRAIKYPEEYQALGLDMATGVLLYGPPGCGKTLVAKAIANEAGANFISVKGPELLNKYVGESERAVRQLFTRARASSPCILFFDEMDAMAPRRGTDGNGAAERVVNQLLTEMDGLEQRKSIFLIAATNRPDMIDPALLRPGRLDTLLYVPLPDPPGRASILRTLVRNTPLAAGVDVSVIGESNQCEGFSGADLHSLVREACTEALKERVRNANGADNMSHAVDIKQKLTVTSRHFETALTRVSPSVSATDRKRYEALRLKLRRSRGHLRKPEGDTDLSPTNDADLKSTGIEN